MESLHVPPGFTICPRCPDPRVGLMLSEQLTEHLIDSHGLHAEPRGDWAITVDGEGGLTCAEFLIEDVIPESGVTTLVGDWNTGKTFLAVDWSVCIASGTPWLGHHVRRGTVVYITTEGVRGLGQRLHVAKRERGIEGDLPIIRVSRSIRGADAEGLGQLREVLAHEVDTRKLPPIRAVVLDTLAQNMTGDENSTEDMAAFVGRFKAWCASLSEEPVAAIVLHHPGHGDKRRARGSSVLSGDADCEMLLAGHLDRLTLSCAKMRDTQRFEDAHLHLARVPVMKDEGGQLRDRRGREQWSLVVRANHRAKDREFGDGLSPDEEKVLAALPIEPENADWVRARAKLGLAAVRSALCSLHERGLAARHGGQRPGSYRWATATATDCN